MCTIGANRQVADNHAVAQLLTYNKLHNLLLAFQAHRFENDHQRHVLSQGVEPEVEAKRGGGMAHGG